MAIKKDQHVVPTGDRWGVRSTGSDRSTKVFETKDTAVKFAREIARQSHTGVYVHGKDGMVISKDTYAPNAAGKTKAGSGTLDIVKGEPKWSSSAGKFITASGVTAHPKTTVTDKVKVPTSSKGRK